MGLKSWYAMGAEYLQLLGKKHKRAETNVSLQEEALNLQGFYNMTEDIIKGLELEIHEKEIGYIHEVAKNKLIEKDFLNTLAYLKDKKLIDHVIQKSPIQLSQEDLKKPVNIKGIRVPFPNDKMDRLKKKLSGDVDINEPFNYFTFTREQLIEIAETLKTKQS